ncbi:hypothetical protein [Legionella sp. km772]|uniref:hypothetical protein n=1 Tax=Legionella sp. km772 TaxID=2498111 RepID=UPI000F8CBA48|nr:hypothetical protein [Legionella sp. km772]RUR09868.1 hypothetical protein ELY15_08770 [Legionella sp. km772]
MNKKDLINEYIGIIAIIVIVALAVLAIYFYIKHQPDNEIKDMSNTTISFNSSDIPKNIG